jgi:heterodisulfide reductase subunit A
MGNDVLIIGAGVAGLKAAVALDEFGIGTVIVEKTPAPGGKVKEYARIFPTFSSGKLIVKDLLDRIRSSPRIRLSAGTEATSVSREKGRFRAALSNGHVVDLRAIIVAAGFDSFDPIRQPEYGYGVYPNVISSVELESVLDPDGPTKGRVLKPSDGKPAKKIALVFCVGSRNVRIGAPYCSRICCSFSTKQAIEIKEKDRETSVTCFYMDIRTYGKGFEEMYRYAQELGVKYVRGRVSEISMDLQGTIQVRAENTLLGKPMQGLFDVVSLAVGMRPCEDAEKLSRTLGIERDKDGFFSLKNDEENPHESSQPGIFLAGAATGLKPIRDCLLDGASAGGAAASYLRTRG